ncbi:hypothetical protein ACFFJB_07595 [Camelimonas abortus]|uniref:Uncharacterized protein n=1 Tax=Camelimonas abortus TaxID=1017184 RepID=A0ABV7LFU0_9HYPH
MDSPLQFVRHLSVLRSHRIHFGGNGSEPAAVNGQALFLRLFATHDCSVSLEDARGEARTFRLGARQAWIATADGVAAVRVGPAPASGRLYVNELG